MFSSGAAPGFGFYYHLKVFMEIKLPYYLSKKMHFLLFSRINQLHFLEDILSLIEDGVPVTQAIGIVRKTSSGISSKVAESFIHVIAEGKKLADGMEGWFPQAVIDIVRTGEDGGSLTTSLKSAIQLLASQTSIASSLFGSLAYPFVVLIMGCIVAIFLKHSIFSSFISIKPLASWPAHGQTFYSFATFLEHWWWLLLFMAVFLIILLGQIFRLFVGEGRKVADKFPPFTLYRAIMAARFMEILGLLVANGMPFKNALTTIQEKANRYLVWHIYIMQFHLSGGRENIAEVLDTGLIDEQDILRLKIIARGKNFEQALLKLAKHAAERNERRLKLAGKILGGVLLALGAGFAIFMILAVYNVGTSIGVG